LSLFFILCFLAFWISLLSSDGLFLLCSCIRFPSFVSFHFCSFFVSYSFRWFCVSVVFLITFISIVLLRRTCPCDFLPTWRQPI
jgi:hypothetical protein